jgi:hypothetical protein
VAATDTKLSLYFFYASLLNFILNQGVLIFEPLLGSWRYYERFLPC